jgi:subtilisin family serine protease
MSGLAVQAVGISWGLRSLGIDALWRKGLTGAGVRVGHLDTGVAGHHPALAGRVAAFLETDEEGRVVPSATPRDTASHGTHTAGILCGGVLDGEAIGVAPEALLHSAAVIDGGRNVVRILRGIDWLRGSGVRVLGMALGIAGPNPVFWTLLDALRAEGVLTVCAIGNDGAARPHSPALYPGVLAVGAANEQQRLAPYTGCELASGECLKPELLAPGVDLRSATPHSGGGTLGGGTSQACAFTAGVACLLFQACPDATPDEVAEALCASASPIDEAHGLRYRFGLLQPALALELLQRRGARSGGSEPAGSEPPFYRDEELLDECRDASPASELHCVVVASGRARGDSARGAAGPVVDRVTEMLGEPPASVEYLPAGRIAIVSASPRFIVALGRDPDVQVLSAATVHNGRTLF